MHEQPLLPDAVAVVALDLQIVHRLRLGPQGPRRSRTGPDSPDSRSPISSSIAGYPRLAVPRPHRVRPVTPSASSLPSTRSSYTAPRR